MRGSDHLIPLECLVGTTTPTPDAGEVACPECGSDEEVEPTWRVGQFHCSNCYNRFDVQ